jgi:putative transcriptional regulator|nr:transcriptional regulator [Clostridia bacterium]
MANHITQLRKRAGFETAKKAAKALGISNGMMYQMEGGYKKPSPDLALKMAKLFQCTLEEIFLPFNTTNSDKYQTSRMTQNKERGII